jgi:hypothetical protein
MILLKKIYFREKLGKLYQEKQVKNHAFDMYIWEHPGSLLCFVMPMVMGMTIIEIEEQDIGL